MKYRLFAGPALYFGHHGKHVSKCTRDKLTIMRTAMLTVLKTDGLESASLARRNIYLVKTPVLIA